MTPSIQRINRMTTKAKSIVSSFSKRLNAIHQQNNTNRV
jgi:hypothetical protein